MPCSSSISICATNRAPSRSALTNTSAAPTRTMTVARFAAVVRGGAMHGEVDDSEPRSSTNAFAENPSFVSSDPPTSPRAFHRASQRSTRVRRSPRPSAYSRTGAPRRVCLQHELLDVVERPVPAPTQPLQPRDSPGFLLARHIHARLLLGDVRGARHLGRGGRITHRDERAAAHDRTPSTIGGVPASRYPPPVTAQLWFGPTVS